VAAHCRDEPCRRDDTKRGVGGWLSGVFLVYRSIGDELWFGGGGEVWCFG
jgi:hypothetical protein